MIMASATFHATSETRASLIVCSTTDLGPGITPHRVFRRNSILPSTLCHIISRPFWRHLGERTLPACIRHRYTGPFSWSDGMGYLLIWNLVNSFRHWQYVAATFLLRWGLWIHPLFEPCETLNFSRKMHDRMLPDCSDLPSCSKCLTTALACMLPRSLTNRKYLVNGHCATGSSPYASHYCRWIVICCWSWMGNCTSRNLYISNL